MDIGRLYFFVAFLACLWIATLDALPTKGPHSAAQKALHWQYPRDPNTTLGNTTTTWAVACVYPVSGIYTRMQRLLLYVVTAFVFLLRSYDWLITVGMTFVLTYASVACIHAFLLSTLHGIGPDFDAMALQGIMVSTTIAICCYSIVSRRISDYAIAPLFYIWISAMLVTSVMTCVSMNGIMGDITTFVVPAGCSADGKCNPGACSNATSHGLFRSEMDQLVPMALEQWMYYNASNLSEWNGYYPASEFCLDCGGSFYTNGSTVYNPLDKSPLYVLYAAYTTLLMFLVFTRMATRSQLFNPSKFRNVVFFYFLMRSKTSTTPFHDVFGLLFIFTLSPASIRPRPSSKSIVRNEAHRAGKDVRDSQGRTAIQSFLLYDLSTASEVELWHIYNAKLLASCCFVCSWSARIILLMLPVVTVVLSELTLARLPESEAPRLVGQWAPFIYVGLALLASLILKFLNYWRVGVQEQRRIIYLGHPDSTEQLKPPLRRLTEEYESNLHFNPYLMGKELKKWWKDPVNVAKQDYEDMRRQVRFEFIAARRRAAKRRQKELSRVGDDEDAVPVFEEPVQRLEFDKFWERLSTSASGSQKHRDWSTQIPSTFEICRQDYDGNSLVDTGWITATYEEEEYETISTAEIRRREAKALRDREDRERLADSLETFIGDVLEFGGFELR